MFICYCFPLHWEYNGCKNIIQINIGLISWLNKDALLTSINGTNYQIHRICAGKDLRNLILFSHCMYKSTEAQRSTWLTKINGNKRSSDWPKIFI